MVNRLLVLMLLACSASAGAAEEVDSPIDGWREVIFANRTVYREAEDCVKAVSSDAASGLVRRRNVDLTQRPVLSWRWRAEQPLQGADADEQSKAGDDFLARVYVVHEGFFPWQTRAVNYVWAREVAAGKHWPNPFAGQAIMVAVQSGAAGLGQWQEFRRNVRADFRRFHDQDIDQIDAVALMTDTDNTGGRAQACYQLPRFLPAGSE